MIGLTKPLYDVALDLPFVPCFERSQFVRQNPTAIVIPLISLIMYGTRKKRHRRTSCLVFTFELCIYISIVLCVFFFVKPVCTCLFLFVCTLILMLNIVCLFLSCCKVSSVIVCLRLLTFMRQPHSFDFCFIFILARFESIYHF